MKSKTLYIGLAVVAIGLLVVGIVVFTSGDDLIEKDEVSDQEQAANESVADEETLRENHEDNATQVIASVNWEEWDEILRKYEKSDLPFNRDESDDTVIYWHQREIDGAIVEFDYINYQFDKDTKELKKKIIHWRDDLPEHLPPIITKEEAESKVRGKVQFAKLYYIDPESSTLPIKPTPKNPCWVVRSMDDNGNIIDTIIDAVEGKILGYGVPPP